MNSLVSIVSEINFPRAALLSPYRLDVARDGIAVGVVFARACWGMDRLEINAIFGTGRLNDWPDACMITHYEFLIVERLYSVLTM